MMSKVISLSTNRFVNESISDPWARPIQPLAKSLDKDYIPAELPIMHLTAQSNRGNNVYTAEPKLVKNQRQRA